MIERLAGLPAEVDLGSELRYRDAVIGPETLVIAISQSGETADTIGSIKMAKQRGCPTLSITNVVGSALARETTGVLYMHAGPEIGVASTKAFTAMLVAGYLFALWLGQQRGAITPEDVKKRITDLVELPGLVEQTLELDASIAQLAKELAVARDFLYLGRGLQFPIALEGALKLKEISYIHAEGLRGRRDEARPDRAHRRPAPRGRRSRRATATTTACCRTWSRCARATAWSIAVTDATDTVLAGKADHVIRVPPTSDLLSPILTVIPMQFLAYHIAVRRGCDVDQPRNLAKSVTVE